MRKKNLSVVLLLFLLVALFGIGKSFASPVENNIIKPLKVLEYQQTGNFDYAVTTKPAYFYGNLPSIPSEASPQIPVHFIESFNVSYNFRSGNNVMRSIEINAVLESPGAWEKTINLVPRQDGPASFNITFALDLKYFKDLADTIEKEIGVSSSSRDLTIQAVVSNGTAEEFVQLLPIKMSRSFIKISDSLTSTQNENVGKFDYQVKLGENTLFGAVTLTPPSNPANTIGKTLGPADTIFASFIESMKVSFTYNITADKPLNQTDTEVTIEAIAENPNKWSKTYILVPPTKQKGDFTVNFPLDLTQFSTIFDTIQQETRVSASTQDLTLQATVRAIAQTDSGTIDKTFTQRIKTNLREGILTWSGTMKKSEGGTIEITQVIIEQARWLGVPILWIRILSSILAAILVILLGYYFITYRRPKQEKAAVMETKAREANRKYRAMMVEVKDWPEIKPGQTILPVDSLEDLIKVAQGVLKPVNHKAATDKHIYWVNDESTRYEYRLTNGHLPSEEDVPTST